MVAPALMNNAHVPETRLDSIRPRLHTVTYHPLSLPATSMLPFIGNIVIISRRTEGMTGTFHSICKHAGPVCPYALPRERKREIEREQRESVTYTRVLWAFSTVRDIETAKIAIPIEMSMWERESLLLSPSLSLAECVCACVFVIGSWLRIGNGKQTVCSSSHSSLENRFTWLFGYFKHR